MSDELRSAVEAALAEHRAQAVTVDDLEPISMGASKDLWRFRATIGGQTHRLVLRRDSPGRANPDGMRREAAVMQAASRAGVPVPHVWWVGDGQDAIGAPAIIMDHVEGESLPKRILRTVEANGTGVALAQQLGGIAARVHSVELGDELAVAGLSMGGTAEPYEVAAAQSPAIEIARRWLNERPPAPGAPSLVHGDLRLGNILVDGDIRAALDWELAHLGDPVEDLGWLCVRVWRFGSPHRAAGFGSVGDLLDGYASVAGWRPSEHDVLWWEVRGTIRWAFMCLKQAGRFTDGSEPSLELALIGRRFAENEWDLLLALGLADPDLMVAPGPEDGAVESISRHGAPSGPVLLEALASELTERGDYRSRLLARAAGVAMRESVLGPELVRVHAEHLRALGMESEEELAAEIRGGVRLTPEVMAAVHSGIAQRLLVWDPSYAESTDVPSDRSVGEIWPTSTS
ncbi:phosphotransferase family protein [Kribbia dieselivorans]|uniref:phosphotransferase family protein n=1 Tax=Kribbia dieselivorans TaxID=331526 RepID=UPI0008393C36|nr:phosphotransferase family protein [Kribbia dieselivorans]